MTASSFIELLKDRIGITRVPFSDRSSRLLVFKEVSSERLYIKLAERLTAIQPWLDTYRFRPPYIQDLCFINSEGMPLSYHLTTLSWPKTIVRSEIFRSTRVTRKHYHPE